MGLGLLCRKFGLEALLRIEPWPSSHAGPNDAGSNDAEPNAGADDSVAPTTVPAGPDAVLGKLLKLV